jgi:hypothetical protein
MSQLLLQDANIRRRLDANEDRAVVRSRSRTPATPDSAHTRRRSATILSQVFTVAIILVLWVGWLNRDDNGLTPDGGVGYWLGITGSSLMLVLLLYPLRKRVRALRVIGTIAFWFRTHMVLGVLGPVLVLWHANFHLGSINSSVALVTMLVVAASGIVGRYLHSKIHLDLYGRKAKAREVFANADDELSGLVSADPRAAGRVIAGLNAFARLGTATPKGLLAGLGLLLVIGWQGAVVRKRLVALARHAIAVDGKRCGRSKKIQSQRLARVTDFVTQHIGAAQKAATFAFYERLFRLWHVLHVPLFILLVIVALIHVFAAHFF